MSAIVIVAGGGGVQFGNLGLLLELVGALGGFGAVITGVVMFYKAKSEKELNSVQAMAVLFEKQREINLDLIAQHDADIKELEEQLRSTGGESEALRTRLEECIRERVVLRNQVVGLEATILTLREQNPPKH